MQPALVVVLYCIPFLLEWNAIQQYNAYNTTVQQRDLTGGVFVWYNDGSEMCTNGKEASLMAYMDFPDGLKGQKQRKAFFLSDDGFILIRGWRRQGIPLTKIAEEYVGVSRSTFWGWYRESEDLRKACAVALETTNLSVEEALLKRALGYDYYDEQYELIEGELRLVRQHKHHVPPDTKAILSWLFNRLPNRWRAVQEPLEATQYIETVKNILVAMKEVAEGGEAQTIEVKEDGGV